MIERKHFKFLIDEYWSWPDANKSRDLVSLAYIFIGEISAVFPSPAFGQLMSAGSVKPSDEEPGFFQVRLNRFLKINGS